MKFFPVAAPTASAICTMSASLKLGVIRWFDCCAKVSELTALSRTPSEAPSASARSRWDNPVIVISKHSCAPDAPRVQSTGLGYAGPLNHDLPLLSAAAAGLPEEAGQPRHCRRQRVLLLPARSGTSAK